MKDSFIRAAEAKPVERSHQDRELNRAAFDHLEKSFHLGNRVKRSGIRQAFGPIHLIHRVIANQVMAHRVFQSLVNVGIKNILDADPI